MLINVIEEECITDTAFDISKMAEVYQTNLGFIRRNIKGWLDDGQVVPGFESFPVDSNLCDDTSVKFFRRDSETLVVAEIPMNKKGGAAVEIEYQIIENNGEDIMSDLLLKKAALFSR